MILNKYNKHDFIIMLLCPLLAGWLSLQIKANFLVSTLLFFGLPAFWLSLRKPYLIKKSLIFSVIFSLPFGIIIDYLAALDNSWFVQRSIFSIRILGLVPIEDLAWAFLWVYFAVIFYEFFLDFGKAKDKLSRNLIYLLLSLLILSLSFALFIFIAPSFLLIRYFYLKMGLLLVVVPIVLFLSFFRNLWSKYLKIGVFFAGLSFIFELVGVRLNQWTFPGQNFVGKVNLFGTSFPYEELVFWIILGVAGILSYYEFFADDRR